MGHVVFLYLPCPSRDLFCPVRWAAVCGNSLLPLGSLTEQDLMWDWQFDRPHSANLKHGPIYVVKCLHMMLCLPTKTSPLELLAMQLLLIARNQYVENCNRFDTRNRSLHLETH